MLLPARTSRTIPLILIAAFLRSYSQTHLRRRCLLLTLAAALIALPSVQLQGQEPADEVVRVDTHLLVYPIRVRHKRGQVTPQLTQGDLLLEDKDHVTAGLYLYPGADRVEIIFALDQSGSLREIISQQREAALALVGRFGNRSQVAVIRFAETPSLVLPFGADPSAASLAFDFPAQPNQHTAIFDAAAAAVKAFEALPRIRSERRIVVLISDGLDNASTAKAGQVIEAAFQKQISFYVIHLPLFEPRDGRLAVRTPAKGFRELAEKTGGKYFLAGNKNSALESPARTSVDLTPIFQAIEEDLKSQYLLGFYAGEGMRDGSKHRFTISLPAGFEYQFGAFSFSRSHEFFVMSPEDAQKFPKFKF